MQTMNHNPSKHARFLRVSSFDVYGMDSLQAVNMASNIDAVLERLGKKYDFYWSSGEPYFDDDNTGPEK